MAAREAKAKRGGAAMTTATPKGKARDAGGREERLGEAMELLRCGVGSILDGEKFRRYLDPEDGSSVAGRVYDGLSRLCEAEGVAVETKEQRPGAYGSYHRGEKRITLNSRLSVVEQATTLAHELAHHLLHAEGDGASRGARETEAEGASYALFSYFGLETGRFTFAYVGCNT